MSTARFCKVLVHGHSKEARLRHYCSLLSSQRKTHQSHRHRQQKRLAAIRQTAGEYIRWFSTCTFTKFLFNSLLRNLAVPCRFADSASHSPITPVPSDLSWFTLAHPLLFVSKTAGAVPAPVVVCPQQQGAWIENRKQGVSHAGMLSIFILG